MQVPGNYPYPELETSLCGNGVLEPGEMCDCGNFAETCNDECCYPAHIRLVILFEFLKYLTGPN